jgi:hypothetical protein
MGNQARQKSNSQTVQTMGKAVKHQSLKTRVAKENFQPVASSRVSLKDNPEVS